MPAQSGRRPLKKATKGPTGGNKLRPVNVRIGATFPQDGARKVTPADLNAAAAAAAQVFRSTLDLKGYEVHDLEVETRYSYTMSDKKITL